MLSILWCCASGNRVLIYLAKSCNFQNTKVENLKHLFSYCKQFLQILAKKLEFFGFLAICFQEIGIYDIKVVFQKHHKWRKSPKKITGLNSNFVKKNLSKYADFSTFSHHTFFYCRGVKIPQIKHEINRKDVSDELNSLHCHFHCQGPQYWVVIGAPLFQVGARQWSFKFWPLLDIFIYTQSDIWWAVSSKSKNCPALVCSSVGQVWLSRSTHLMVIRMVLMVGNYGSQKIKITGLSVVSL